MNIAVERFFKTGPGEYGEGDQFLGIRVPVLRKGVKENREISLDLCQELLKSPLHEVRLLALLLKNYQTIPDWHICTETNNPKNSS